MTGQIRVPALALLGLVGWVLYCMIESDRQWQLFRQELRVTLAYQRGLIDGAMVSDRRDEQRRHEQQRIGRGRWR